MEKLIDLHDTLISDLHKDARGFRPRHLPRYMPESEFQALWDDLIETMSENDERERCMNLDHQRELEMHLSRLQEAYGAADRQQAIRWYWEGQDEEDVGYWAYLTGIAYDLVPMYMAEIKAAGFRVYAS